jgi:hypothetical protein
MRITLMLAYLVIDMMQGKLDTEALLESKGVNWTSIRPVYIYGETDNMNLGMPVFGTTG